MGKIIKDVKWKLERIQGAIMDVGADSLSPATPLPVHKSETFPVIRKHFFPCGRRNLKT
jgi:hypothetical protein